MSAIRFRPNAVCAQVLGDVPGGTAYVKKKQKKHEVKSAFPVRWCGFVCKCRAHKIGYARKGKLEATAVTNGDVIASEWRDLRQDQYVLCMLVQIGDANDFGAFAVVDEKNWPIVISEDAPRLTIINEWGGGRVVNYSKLR